VRRLQNEREEGGRSGQRRQGEEIRGEKRRERENVGAEGSRKDLTGVKGKKEGRRGMGR
jgi:hypothetical protein